MPQFKDVAIIGCGPAGAITIDALAREGITSIKVYERREKPGGCWLADPKGHVQQLPDIEKLSQRTADEPIDIPDNLPTWTPRCQKYRFSDTSIHPLLETNISAEAMQFSEEPFPEERSDWSVQRHGKDTPFRHHSAVQQYIEDLVNRNGYQNLVEYNTTVERLEKVGERWQLILRKEVGEQDYWWSENFDAVIDATGHYNVPFIPHIDGLADFAKAYPGHVEHTKAFRDPENYRGKVRIVNKLPLDHDTDLS